MFALIIGAGTNSLRSLSAADDYSYQSNEELRAVDFIVRDLRRALTVTISPSGDSLSLTMPDFYVSYDKQGNPNGAVATPTIVKGVPEYGDARNPLLITYAVSSSELIRTQTIPATGAVSRAVVCSRVRNLSLKFVELNTTVNFNITFDPNYRTISTALKTATNLSATVAVRAIRFK